MDLFAYLMSKKVIGGGETITGSGTSISLSDTASNNPINLTLSPSELSQDETPTPESPQTVHTCNENNTVIVCSKNMFNGSLFDGITQNENGTYKTTKYYVNSTEVTFRGIPSTKYTISFWNTDLELNSFTFSLAVNGSWVNTTTTHKWTFTTDANGETKLKLGAGSYAAIGTEDRFIQIELGEQATTYNPYKSVNYSISLGSVEYCKIGTYSDELIKASASDTGLTEGKWYIKKNIDKVVLDGSESWYSASTGVDYIEYACSNIIANGKTGYNSCISNYFSNLSNNRCLNNGTSCLIRTPDLTLSTVSDFKTWLSTHNTDVYYLLATPTYTLLSDTLQSELEAISSGLKSYANTTNITQTNDDLPFVLSASTTSKVLTEVDKSKYVILKDE